jgi:hypothetical protein
LWPPGGWRKKPKKRKKLLPFCVSPDGPFLDEFVTSWPPCSVFPVSGSLNEVLGVRFGGVISVVPL